MEVTEGQADAIAEFESIAFEDPALLRVEEVIHPTEDYNHLRIWFSIRVGPIPHKSGGLRFRDRERFLACVPPSFPFARPLILVSHIRFAGFPHVQWSRSLCLYQASVEWNASDGIFGLIDRLWKWILNASINNLDPEDGPLHPPAIYTQVSDSTRIVMCADAPCPVGEFWAGFGVSEQARACLKIEQWISVEEGLSLDGAITTFVLPKALPWEFPTTGKGLLAEIEKQGGDREWFLAVLSLAASKQEEGRPVLVLVGTPMRRTALGGQGIHFAAWRIPDDTVGHLRTSLPQKTDTGEIQVIKSKIASLTLKIFEEAKIEWCQVLEDRKEIVVRRDQGSSAGAAWQGKRVMVLGCGALGSIVSEMVCRSDCQTLVLVDYERVTPGVLVRQNFIEEDIGLRKVDALKERLLRIRPGLLVETLPKDAIGVLRDGLSDLYPDILLDTTASNMFHQMLEREWKSIDTSGYEYCAFEIDSNAQACIGINIPAGSVTGPWSAFRDLKLDLCREFGPKGLYSRFQRGTDSARPFQPEPGCSEPTFVGSASDMALLASTALNTSASWYQHAHEFGRMGFAFEQPEIGRSHRFHCAALAEHQRIKAHGYDICVDESAIQEMFANIRKNSREQDTWTETGGLLWGQWDNAARILWVTDASDAPPDSIRSPERFICGTEGTAEENSSRSSATLGACEYIGMWHSHPSSPPIHSSVDLQGMLQILLAQENCPRKLLLLIVGREGENTVLGSYLYQKSSTEEFEQVKISPCLIPLGVKSWQ
ncbi:MAG: ThiF family adenylyltransferase [Desulfovermiculus sp.]|nr:ThiF family adenylyltransferase [Desulfovermiculus sp.]